MGIDSLADIIRHHAAQIPDNQALLYTTGNRGWTFKELNDESSQVAQALKAEGVGTQDRIAYLDKNSPEYFIYLFGGGKLNAVSVAVNWRLAPPEMEYILNNSEAKTLLIGEEFLGHLAKINLETVTKVVVIGDPGDSGYIRYEDWIAGQPAEDPNVATDPQEDTCYQLYTSGTTGLPKGVELTHSNFLTAMNSGFKPLNFNAESVNLVCMPLFHIAGSGWGIVGMYEGARTLLLRDVDLPEILATLPKEGVTHSLFVPAVLQFLLTVPGVADADYSKLQAIVYGASPITEEVLVNAMKTFGCGFFQAYGLTETTGGICLLHADDHDPGGPRAHLLRSCGPVIDTHELRICDSETGDEMPEGEVGEIWVKGPQVMKGYWKNPEATAKSITHGGWFHTGDAGYVKEGYVYIHDRVKDMIISGGENIYPAEIENALMKHPEINDAAVIGVPSDRWGETVKAIITRKGPDLTEQDVIDFCRENLARYKCPTSVDWMDEIPRNPSGKILKVELREPYWEGKSRRVS
ncbi:MAG: long-chain-fatty-acid--CoA ligase [Pseudomonadota bacterium]